MTSNSQRQQELAAIALLDAAGGEIKGKTRIQKLAFLLDREELGDDIDIYEFIKYDYGPFSKKLLEVLEHLEKRGYVRIRRSQTMSGNTRYDYEIPDDLTLDAAVDEISSGSVDYRSLKQPAEEIHDEYGDWPIRRLVEYVYSNYPEYEKNSVYQY